MKGDILMNPKVKRKKRGAVVLDNRATASLFVGAKNGISNNLLLERHYFRLELADTPWHL